MIKIKKSFLLIVFVVSITSVAGAILFKPVIKNAYYNIIGQKTVDDVVRSIEKDVSTRLSEDFLKAKVSFPPQKITLISLKQEKNMELWAFENNQWVYVKTFPILGLSGKSGPKLAEGDRQVPEGIYKIIGLNPNSYFHLAMLINYPNEYDKKNAKNDNRSNLGGDICIHGNKVSIGCLAMGDNVSEDLFYLVVKAGLKNAKVIISPYDFRQKDIKIENNSLNWIPELYNNIKEELKAYTHKK